ncbi:hypothetical protein [Salipiger mucosus]|uniref:DUF1127 domain-containing protein n=1 Tax=Salipiger mucosus DSM 16094 TaxID=1123237 RepID=S9Q6N7_9RHOB|nr:hypothetical protein [Salipiger mucosus]EPX75672.1 hypothetical protein Salmuc_01137 [Salipiger mucosus DSM 16094]
MSATDIHSVPHHDTDDRGILTRIFDGLISLAEKNQRLRQADKLSAMSDAELARRGLRRDEIVHHVFRDQLYI